MFHAVVSSLRGMRATLLARQSPLSTEKLRSMSITYLFHRWMWSRATPALKGPTTRPLLLKAVFPTNATTPSVFQNFCLVWKNAQSLDSLFYVVLCHHIASIIILASITILHPRPRAYPRHHHYHHDTPARLLHVTLRMNPQSYLPVA